MISSHMICVHGAACALLVAASTTAAAIQAKAVLYEDGPVRLQGHLAYDDAVSGRRPGVLLIHEWWGLNDYAKQRAEQLAALGYVAFAVDMYGQGKVTHHPKEAGQWARQVQAQSVQWRRRALAGLKVLKSDERVDPKRLAAIGYCFGGASVLQLAYSGADLAGVVSFHGSLPVPSDEEAARIKARILICHGAADAFIAQTRISKLHESLERAKVDWQMVYYGQALHSFTNPTAGGYGLEGIGYREDADRRSWQHMKIFFDEIFAQEPTQAPADVTRAPPS